MKRNMLLEFPISEYETRLQKLTSKLKAQDRRLCYENLRTSFPDTERVDAAKLLWNLY